MLLRGEPTLRLKHRGMKPFIESALGKLNRFECCDGEREQDRQKCSSENLCLIYGPNATPHNKPRCDGQDYSGRTYDESQSSFCIRRILFTCHQNPSGTVAGKPCE